MFSCESFGHPGCPCLEKMVPTMGSYINLNFSLCVVVLFGEFQSKKQSCCWNERGGFVCGVECCVYSNRSVSETVPNFLIVCQVNILAEVYHKIAIVVFGKWP